MSQSCTQSNGDWQGISLPAASYDQSPNDCEASRWSKNA